MRCHANRMPMPMRCRADWTISRCDADRMRIRMPLPMPMLLSVSCQMPMPIANSRSDAEPLSGRIAPPARRPVPRSCTINYTAICLVDSKMPTRCHGITSTSAARRPPRCANHITRIALREFCVRHVGPTGSCFLPQPTHDCEFPIPISDRKSWWHTFRVRQ